VERTNSGKEQRKLVTKRKATKSAGDEGTVVTILFLVAPISCFRPQ